MGPKTYFETKFKIGLTCSEMSTILNALYIAQEKHAKNNLNNLAKDCKTLFDKIYDYSQLIINE